MAKRYNMGWGGGHGGKNPQHIENQCDQGLARYLKQKNKIVHRLVLGRNKLLL